MYQSSEIDFSLIKSNNYKGLKDIECYQWGCNKMKLIQGLQID